MASAAVLSRVKVAAVADANMIELIKRAFFLLLGKIKMISRLHFVSQD